MDNLTQRQQQDLDFISRCIDTHGAPPTLREISAHSGTRGAATLKRFYHEGDYIRLQPENRRMQPILIRESDAETVIVGKLLKTIRSYD